MRTEPSFRQAVSVVAALALVVGLVSPVLTPAWAVTTLACPDLTGDGFVDQSDVSSLATLQGGTNAAGDLNGDGTVTSQDGDVLAGYLGFTGLTCSAHTGFKTQSTQFVRACPDLTGDGFVDASDLSALSLNINASTPDLSADLNGDGAVNNQDANVWAGFARHTVDCGSLVTALQVNQQPVPSPAALTISKTDGRTTASPGEATTYIITVTNSGEADATGVRITDSLPGNYGSVTAISDGGTLFGGTVTWDALAVPAKGSKSVSLSGNVASALAVGTTTLTNTASLGCTAGPSCAFSGSATDATAVTVAPVPTPGAPALTLAKRVSVDTLATAGDVVSYTVTVSNSAAATATAAAVVLTDTLPAGFTFRADGSSVSTFSMGDLAPGEARSLSYDVKVGPAVSAGTYDNVVVAKGSNTDSLKAAASVRVRAPIVLGESVEEAEPQPQVQVLAETGAGAGDFAIGLGAVLLLVGGLFAARRRLA